MGCVVLLWGEQTKKISVPVLEVQEPEDLPPAIPSWASLVASAPDGPPQKVIVQGVDWGGSRDSSRTVRIGYGSTGASLERRIEAQIDERREPVTGEAILEAIAKRQPVAIKFLAEHAKVESRSDGMTRTEDIQIDLAPEIVPPDGLILRQIDGKTLWQRRADGYWNATAMCQAAGKLVNNYTRNAETQEFLTELSSITRISVMGLVVGKPGGRDGERGTWVHPKVAYHLAQWLSPRFAVRVSGWIDELLTTGKVDLRPEPDLKTVPGLRRELREGALKLLASLEYQEELEANLAVAEERAVVAEDKALEQAKQAGREERAIPLSVWLNHTMNQHGHGPIIGRKMMSALGLLKVEMVRGCAHTVEAEISAKMLRNNVLLYRTQTVQKTKVLEKGKPAVPLVDRRGNPVMVTSRTVCVDADVGPDWLMTWFMAEPECALLHRGCHFVSVVSAWARWFSSKRERGASLLQ